MLSQDKMNINDMEEIPDVYIGNDTSPSKIIFQIQNNHKNEVKDLDNQIQFLETQHGVEKFRYEEAFRKWCQQKAEFDRKFDILFRRREEKRIGTIRKIKLYRLLEEVEPRLCIDAYKLASSSRRQNIEEIKEEIKNDNTDEDTIKKIAVNLFEGHYCLFPSQDADEWYDVAHIVSQRKRPPSIAT